jgi:hypothetical protein
MFTEHSVMPHRFPPPWSIEDIAATCVSHSGSPEICPLGAYYIA